MEALASDHELIQHLESVLSQIMDANTPTDHKNQLEQQLMQWKHQHSSAIVLRVFTHILASCTNEYLLWFAINSMEEVVSRHWTSIHHFTQKQKLHIRQFLWTFMLQYTFLPSSAFVLRKVRKVLTDIARYEWKSVHHNTWPDFLLQLKQLITDSNFSNVIAGMQLLESVMDEFGRENALVLAQVKRHAQDQVLEALPSLMNMIQETLSACCHEILMDQAAYHRFSNVQEQDQLAVIALQAIVYASAWAPVHVHLDLSKISLLFQIAVNYRFHSRGSELISCGSSVAAIQALIEVAGKPHGSEHMAQVLSHYLNCICMLLQATLENASRIDEEYWTKLCELLHSFLSQHISRLQNPTIQHLVPNFLSLIAQVTVKQELTDGFLNCLRVWEVFVGYLEQAQQDQEASNAQAQSALEAYESGLVSVVLHIVERVNHSSPYNQLLELSDQDDGEIEEARLVSSASHASDTSLDEENVSAYGSHSLCSLQDLAQQSNAQDDVGPNSGEPVDLTERKQFVVESLALIQRIAAFPSCIQPLLDYIYPIVQKACQSLLFHIHETPLSAPNSDTWKKERYAVRDLTTNSAILSSVSAQYIARHREICSDKMYASWHILQLFLAMAEYAVQHKLHTRGDAFVDLLCEILCCVRVCLSGCLDALSRQQSDSAAEIKQQFCPVSEKILQIVLKILDTSIVPSPELVMQCALQLLAHLGFVVVHEELRALPSMIELEKNMHQFSLGLPLAIQGDLYAAMSNSIINSSISMDNARSQDWHQVYANLVLPIREGIVTAAMTLQQNEHRVHEQAIMTRIRRDCNVVCYIAASIETKPKSAKDVFFAAYEAIFPALLSLLKVYFTAIKRSCEKSSNPQHAIKSALKVVQDLVRLYAQLLKSIRKELQKERVATIMQTFVSIFEDAQLCQILRNHGAAGVSVLCGLLRLLTIVLAEPTAVFASFLPSILQLCFGPLKESIFVHPDSECINLSSYVAMVEQILLQHFRFFIVTSNIVSEGKRARAFASDVGHTYFQMIFESLANILGMSSNAQTPQESASPKLCRQTLLVLDRVDQTHQLFSFEGFRDAMRMGYMSTLLLMLVNGEMNLLQDEIVQLLHRLAQVDFTSFFQQFIPTITERILTGAQMKAATELADPCLQWSGQMDVPTFTKELLSFVNDIRVIQAQHPT